VTEAQPPVRIPWRTAVIAGLRDETANARRLLLHVPNWPGHLAGQHVDVRLTAADGYQTQRTYSIASAPRAQSLELVVDRIPGGEVSPYLTREARKGDRVQLRGPIGGYFFWTAERAGPLLLIGGGSGIVPLASILASRAIEAPALATRVLYSVRTTTDVMFGAELQTWTRENSALTVFKTFTRAAAADGSGYRRRIDIDMLRDIAFGPELHPLIYVCGPTSMVEHTADLLLALEHRADRILTERFGASGELGPCIGDA
jgi:ferredoxin-NADP reductase